MAQTSITIQDIVVVQIRNWKERDLNVSPVARYLIVSATLSLGSVDFLILVSCFTMKGAILSTRDTNFTRGILIYLLKPRVSSTANSLKIMWYAPRSSRCNNHSRHQILRSSLTGASSSNIIIKITSIFLFQFQSFQSKATARPPLPIAAILFFPVHEHAFHPKFISSFVII